MKTEYRAYVQDNNGGEDVTGEDVPTTLRQLETYVRVAYKGKPWRVTIQKFEQTPYGEFWAPRVVSRFTLRGHK